MCEFVGFHIGINNLNILLLYEATLRGMWLQTFRETVCVCDFEKNKRRIRLLRLNIETNFFFKCAGNQYSLATVSKCKVG
jgi:hypothetical protein